VAAGLVGTALPEVFYRTRDLFHKMPIPKWTKPGLGGLLLGLLALALPQVLGGGYGWIQLAIDGKLALHLLVLLLFAKMAAFALTVSSGGSGGVFAPSLFVGAMLGGVFAIVLHQMPAVFVVVGMAAVFGAAARVPIATMLMVTEMAGGYDLLLPTGLTVMIAWLVQKRLSTRVRYRSLYEGQVPTQKDSPAHYLEEIRAAMNLLGRRSLPLADDLGHLDLLKLLRSRVKFDLPGGRQLTMGRVLDKEEVAGKSLGNLYQLLDAYDFEVVALLRGEHMLLPHPRAVLEAEDRLVMIVSPKAVEPLAEYVETAPAGLTTDVPAEGGTPGSSAGGD
jgi:CIC family chloride channel protein